MTPLRVRISWRKAVASSLCDADDGEAVAAVGVTLISKTGVPVMSSTASTSRPMKVRMFRELPQGQVVGNVFV